MPKNSDLSYGAQNKFMKSVNSGDHYILCDIPVDLCQTEHLDRNRDVLEVRAYEIYRLVCERRTSRGVYDRINEIDFIKKLLSINIYYEAYKELERYLLYHDIDTEEPDLECGWNVSSAAAHLDIELDVAEAMKKLFEIVEVDSEAAFSDQHEELKNRDADFLDNMIKKKSDNLETPDEGIYMRMFITMHVMAELGDYSDISPADYEIMQNAYNDSYAVNHDHFSGVYFTFVSEIIICKKTTSC